MAVMVLDRRPGLRDGVGGDKIYPWRPLSVEYSRFDLVSTPRRFGDSLQLDSSMRSLSKVGENDNMSPKGPKP